MFLIAGPCLIESYGIIDEVASELSKYKSKTGLEIYLKGSYRKANRTSVSSFEGIGDEKALEILKSVGEKYSLPTITDVHLPSEVAMAAEYVNAIQIPAFLARQTELLVKAGETGLPINIKKGQFMSPYDVVKAAKKVESTGNKKVWLCERGTFFGYNDLVVDFRSMAIMRNEGYNVVYDATHSLQRPSIGEQSGGYGELIPNLARAAVASGIDGLFMEIHPDPQNAKSDKETQLPLDKFVPLMDTLLAIEKAAQSN
ncbi:MAG: 3-deoxy-8-phosphooctulonate synthase [Candidatus Kapaibacteriales bacterium]